MKIQVAALDKWRWRIGIAMLAFAGAWLVCGAIGMWFVWRPLAIGHAALGLFVIWSLSERMRRYYFRAIHAPERDAEI